VRENVRAEKHRGVLVVGPVFDFAPREERVVGSRGEGGRERKRRCWSDAIEEEAHICRDIATSDFIGGRRGGRRGGGVRSFFCVPLSP
jgi:hypothetical protein